MRLQRVLLLLRTGLGHPEHGHEIPIPEIWISTNDLSVRDINSASPAITLIDAHAKQSRLLPSAKLLPSGNVRPNERSLRGSASNHALPDDNDDDERAVPPLRCSRSARFTAVRQCNTNRCSVLGANGEQPRTRVWSHSKISSTLKIALPRFTTPRC